MTNENVVPIRTGGKLPDAVARTANGERLTLNEEWEFSTKARAAGVSERLVRLGNAVWDVTGQSVADMIRVALDAPDATYADWSALYLASMETH